MEACDLFGADRTEKQETGDIFVPFDIIWL
jgi:hypothetical protein